MTILGVDLDLDHMLVKSVVSNVEYIVSTTPCNARSSHFQGVLPRNLRSTG